LEEELECLKVLTLAVLFILFHASKESHQIYVGNLSPDIDDQQLFRVFSAFKSIGEARIVRDPIDGSSKVFPLCCVAVCFWWCCSLTVSLVLRFCDF
jgi:hypothetical protein